MSLLFDENLPATLASLVADVFPGCRHVSDLGLISSSDQAIWDAANFSGLAVASKDQDFFNRAIVGQDSVKVVWPRVGNCNTKFIESLLRATAAPLKQFLNDSGATVFILPPGISV